MEGILGWAKFQASINYHGFRFKWWYCVQTATLIAVAIGLVSAGFMSGIILGGSLQMIALGWANVGAAVAQICNYHGFRFKWWYC